MRYRLQVTTVYTNGKTSVENRETVAEADLELHHAEEHERLRYIAQTAPVGRIVTVEDCEKAIVIIYDTGLTKVFNWVAVPE